jgi:pullulanase/glycogen debranching enzyme
MTNLDFESIKPILNTVTSGFSLFDKIYTYFKEKRKNVSDNKKIIKLATVDGLYQLGPDDAHEITFSKPAKNKSDRKLSSEMLINLGVTE